MPDFSVPEEEAEFKGEAGNKRDQTSHRKHLAQLELQAQLKKVHPLLQTPKQAVPMCC